MAANISVTPDQLRQESSHVVTKAGDARSEFATLRTRLQGLEAMFTGEAQDRFQDRYVEWDQHANGLVDALEGLGKFLETAANAIEETDKQLAQGLS